MTVFVPAEPGKRMLVMMPDGYRVWPDSSFDQYEDDRTFFQLNVTGIGENGERVAVRGNHIARVQLALVQPGPECTVCKALREHTEITYCLDHSPFHQEPERDQEDPADIEIPCEQRRARWWHRWTERYIHMHTRESG